MPNLVLLLLMVATTSTSTLDTTTYSINKQSEVWVAVEDHLEASSSSHLHTTSFPTIPAKHIIGLSSVDPRSPQDPVVFATAVGSRGPSVYRLGRAGSSLLAVANSTHSYLESIALDSADNMLYITSRSNRSILRMEAREGASLEVFLETGRRKPASIAIDPCSRRIFWSDISRRAATILSCPPASTNCSPIISSGLYRPKALAIDPVGRRLYWSDSRRGELTLSSSWLDGRGRQLHYRGARKDLFSLAATSSFLYWSDWSDYSLWRISTSATSPSPELVTSFDGSKPHGVATIPTTPLVCTTTDLKLTSSSTSPTTTSTLSTEVAVTDEIGESEESEEEEEEEVEEEVTTEGLCSNFCLGGGSCHLTNTSLPECACPEGRTGERCQNNPCLNYCLQGASCVVVEGAPECLCPLGYTGDRCNTRVTSAALQRPLTPEGSLDPAATPEGSLDIAVLVLAATTAALFLLVLVLSVIVFRLRRRPKVVRKRFISKSRGAPDTKASCGGEQNDGVSLDIEDCCNMTLCDTPCFEPPTRTEGKKKGRGRGGCTDKRSLLSNEERDDLDF